MDFKEIFNKAGLYVADSFAKGVCFEVTAGGDLLLRFYSSPDDITPSIEHYPMHRSLFDKTYKEVFTRQELFK